MYNILSLALSLKKNREAGLFYSFPVNIQFRQPSFNNLPLLTHRPIIRINKNLLVTEL